MTTEAIARKRSPLEKERDLARVEELHLKGYTVTEISAMLGLNKRQVVYDVSELGRRYAKGTQLNLDRHLSRQLRKIDVLERDAWDAWEASKRQREITTRRTRRRDEETMNEVGQRLEQREGDVRFMTVVQWCIAERNKLLGLYAEEPRRGTELAPVTEIIYELPAKQHVHGLSVLGAGQGVVAEPKSRERPPVIVDITPEELWGENDGNVMVIEPKT